jgi:hypothetical protein
MMRSMEEFTFGTISELNMVYYHIKQDVHAEADNDVDADADADADAQKLCTIIFTWHMVKHFLFQRLGA